MIGGIQGSTGVSQDMMLQMRDKMFAKLDGDGDGSIDLAQLSAELESGSVQDSHFSEMIDHLTAADTNGDGLVSQDEFNAMEPPKPPGPPPGEMPGFTYAGDAQIEESYDGVGTLLELFG